MEISILFYPFLNSLPVALVPVCLNLSRHFLYNFCPNKQYIPPANVFCHFYSAQIILVIFLLHGAAGYLHKQYDITHTQTRARPRTHRGIQT